MYKQLIIVTGKPGQETLMGIVEQLANNSMKVMTADNIVVNVDFQDLNNIQIIDDESDKYFEFVTALQQTKHDQLMEKTAGYVDRVFTEMDNLVCSHQTQDLLDLLSERILKIEKDRINA